MIVACPHRCEKQHVHTQSLGQHERSRCVVVPIPISPKIHNRPDSTRIAARLIAGLSQFGLLGARKEEKDMLLCSAVIVVLHIDICCAYPELGTRTCGGTVHARAA